MSKVFKAGGSFYYIKDNGKFLWHDGAWHDTLSNNNGRAVGLWTDESSAQRAFESTCPTLESIRIGSRFKFLDGYEGCFSLHTGGFSWFLAIDKRGVAWCMEDSDLKQHVIVMEGDESC